MEAQPYSLQAAVPKVPAPLFPSFPLVRLHFTSSPSLSVSSLSIAISSSLFLTSSSDPTLFLPSCDPARAVDEELTVGVNHKLLDSFFPSQSHSFGSSLNIRGIL